MPLKLSSHRFGGLALAFAVALGWALTAYAENGSGRTSESEAAAASIPDLSAFTPNKDLVFAIFKTQGGPRIDGRLDDTVWRSAVKLCNFAEISPGDNVKPAVETEAYFAYDENNFYAGFVCYDNAPENIRATITDRDAIFDDDFVGIIIDTFCDQQNGYEFFVNPYGIQGDLRRTQNNEDTSYDTVWRSAGQITDFGWTAEFAIPFRSLRFPDQENQSWGLHVLRIRPRDSREQHSWAPISRDQDCLFCQAGRISGFEGINNGKNIELLPYVIASQSGGIEDHDNPYSSFKNEDAAGDAGFGLKYGITPNFVTDFTYNPDFSQIEADAAQIDVNNTFALFYPERRPFFLEGSDIFNTDITAVYTRSINDPVLAAKLTGKSGKTTVGYIMAKDNTTPYTVPFEEQSQLTVGGESYSNVLRIKRDVLNDSYLGALVTDRRAAGGNGSNTTFGADARIRFNENYTAQTQLLGSYNEEPDDASLTEDFDSLTFGGKKQYNSLFDGEKYSGYALTTSFNRSARHFEFSTWYNDYSPTFRADNGFITANDWRMWGAWAGYIFRTDENKICEIIQPQFNWGRELNHEGVFKDTWYQPSVWIRFRKQTSAWVSYLWSEERFHDVLVPGIRRWQGNADTKFNQYVTGGMWWRIGRSVVRDENPRLGYERNLEFWATVKPTAQLKLYLEYARYRLEELRSRRDQQTGEWLALSGDEIYDVFVLRSRLTYQFSKNLFLRVVGQYVDNSKYLTVDPLLSYKINPFTVFFVGSSHSFNEYNDDPGTSVIEPSRPYIETDRIFFVKFQYLFRV